MYLKRIAFSRWALLLTAGVAVHLGIGARASAQNPMLHEPLGVSMERMGSGTTWIPEAVHLPSRHFTRGSWDFMLHGFLFGQYIKQSGPRGDSQIGSLNWAMLMASHELAGGRFQARTMLSLDPATVTNRGYPLLLQSGETYNDQSLYDRQHPHDFLMELGVMYERAITKSVGLSLYAAPSGEPALGPVAFMHRPSAMDNPLAPLGHHWQDATHIAFGVLSAGLFGRKWKLEGSLFNGREPDEHRWDIDPIKLDSYSGRATFNPNDNWSVSAGYGYIKSPEAAHADESIHRLAVAALYGRQLGTDGQIASTIVYGANARRRHYVLPGGVGPLAESHWTQSVLVETEALLDGSNTVIARAELVQKTNEDLELPNLAVDVSFNIGAVSLGYVREIAGFSGATIGLGGLGTMNLLIDAVSPVPDRFKAAYGSRTPVGGLIFLRIRPKKMVIGDRMPMNHAHPNAQSAVRR